MSTSADTQVEESDARQWKSKSRILGMPISIISIWAALFVASSALPALPVPGMGGMITINVIMTAISGMVLGPAAMIGNMAGALIASLIFPYSSFFGPLGFLTVTIGGLIAGLTFAGKWKLAGLFEILLIGSWFVNPVAWQPWMWIIPLPYSAVALAVIFIKPLRQWIRRQIITGSKVKMWPAVFLMACIGHSAEFLTANVMTNFMWNLSWQYWVPTYAYWVGVDTVIIVISTIIGVGVLYGLKKARLPQAANLYRGEFE